MDIFDKMLEATKAGKLIWKSVGPEVLIPNYEDWRVQSYMTTLDGKEVQVRVELKKTKKNVAFLGTRLVEFDEAVVGMFVDGECVLTSDNELLPGNKQLKSDVDSGRYKMIGFLDDLRKAIEKKDILTVIEADLTRLLLK